MTSPGTHLRQIIKDMKMTQEAFSQQSGIPLNSLRKIIISQQCISLATSEKLGAIFGCPKDYWRTLDEEYREERKKIVRERLNI
jgi:plasmid maintenance system antidote protein VapI